MSFGIVLTRMPVRSIEGQCQEAHCGAAKRSRPLEGSLHADGVGDRASARLTRSRTATRRASGTAARNNRQVSTFLGLAAIVCEGGRRIHGRPCAKHGARALSPDRLHALHQRLPQGSWRTGSGRVAGPTDGAGNHNYWRYKSVWNNNATVTKDVDDVSSGVFEPTTWDCGLDQPVPGRAVCK
jgi:hypothetical protein